MADEETRGVTILYFAWLRERVGLAEELVDVPSAVRTVGELMDWLSGRSSRHAAAFANRTTIRCAVNQDFAESEAQVRPGDEVAFFPPMTGG